MSHGVSTRTAAAASARASFDERYPALLKQALLRIGFESSYEPLTFQRRPNLRNRLYDLLNRLLAPRYELVRRRPYSPEDSISGKRCSFDADTMIGLHRLDNVELAIRTVIAKKIPGDLLEAGVWRGGAAIFMRAALEVFGDSTRRVFVADSFEGLPPPNPAEFSEDKDYDLSNVCDLAVSVERVQANFARYGWLDERVAFLKGWFKDTLPTAPVDSIAVLRADGDLYESTMDILNALYHKVSPGGFVIIDDYGAWPPCKKAVDDFRARHNVTDPIVTIDWTGVYWRKTHRHTQ
jgi:O-methyltransferase